MRWTPTSTKETSALPCKDAFKSYGEKGGYMHEKELKTYSEPEEVC